MADADAALQKYFRDLPMKVKRELAATIREQADGLAGAIRQAAPKKTGRLANSVKVRRGRNSLQLVVTAGGQETRREVRKGSGAPYDYALAVEFGNSHASAEPFFWPTYRAREASIREAIGAAVEKALK